MQSFQKSVVSSSLFSKSARHTVSIAVRPEKLIIIAIALLPCHILILPQATFFYKQKTILNPLSPFILYRRTVLEVFRMLLTLLQFFASKFLVLALHLEAGSFPRPLSPQEEIRAFADLRAGDSSATICA